LADEMLLACLQASNTERVVGISRHRPVRFHLPFSRPQKKIDMASATDSLRNAGVNLRDMKCPCRFLPRLHGFFRFVVTGQ
jgi:hypothetical protein